MAKSFARVYSVPGIVSSIIVDDDALTKYADVASQLHECPAYVTPDYTFDGTSFYVPAPPKQRKFSVLEFRAKFTDEEKRAIKVASLSNIDLGLAYDEHLAAQEVDLDNPEVAQLLGAFVAAGALTQARMDEILA